MPYKWVEPELFMSYFGVNIYNAYKDNDISKKEKYFFTTDVHEDVEESVYIFDVSTFPWWKDSGYSVQLSIERAIDQQMLKIPNRHGVDYPFKRGSFNWYVEHPNKCINQLAHAIMKADMENMIKMCRLFTHMGYAHKMRSWYTPCLKGYVLDAPKEILFKKNHTVDEAYKYAGHGSFFWYLYKSGSFVTCLANAILHGDQNIVKTISTEYPQMVAAAQCENWNKAPICFCPVYNGGLINETG